MLQLVIDGCDAELRDEKGRILCSILIDSSDKRVYVLELNPKNHNSWEPKRTEGNRALVIEVPKRFKTRKNKALKITKL